MDTKLLPLEYANNLIYELEKAFWDERGKGARFRMTNVGQAFYRSVCQPLIKESDVDHILQVVKKCLADQGIVSSISFDRDDRLLRVQVEGCVHQPVEEKMIAQGTEPFTCLPANLIAMAIEEKLDRPVELASIKCDGNGCQLLIIVFDHRPTFN
jgi:hypothetical protein